MADVIRAADFVSNLGIEAKLNYTDSAYVNVGNVISDLNYLGISLVRTSAINSGMSQQGQLHYATAAKAGIRFDFVTNGNMDPAAQVTSIASFEKSYAGSVFGIEGPNEIDHTPIKYAGLTGGAAAIAFQNALSAGVRSSSVLSHAQVYSFSLGSGATPTGGYDSVALHPYPRNGAQPYSTLSNELKYVPAGASAVISETGYSTTPSDKWGVDAASQAKMELNTVFDSLKLGVKTTYLYELLDAYSDSSNSSIEKHYGLFNYDGTPKLAATAIHNLTNILSDKDSTAKTFSTSVLPYSVSGMPSNGSSLVLEKSSGAYDLVLWNEPKIWDSTTHAEVAATTIPETVTLSGYHGDVTIYDPLKGTAAVQTLTNVSSFTVGVQDHPMIVEVSHLTKDASPAAVTDTNRAAAATGSPSTVPATTSSTGAATISIGTPAISTSLTPPIGLPIRTGNHFVQGTSASENIVASSHDAKLTGGGGADWFTFSDAVVHDTITDFGRGADMLDTRSLVDAGYSHTLTQSGSDSILTYSNGTTIKIMGIDPYHVHELTSGLYQHI